MCSDILSNYTIEDKNYVDIFTFLLKIGENIRLHN